MTGMDERLVKVAEVLHEAGSCQYEPVDICVELAQAFAPLLAEWQAEAWDEGYAARRGEDPHGPGESSPYRDSESKED